MKKILIIAVAILALMGCNRTCKPDEVRTKEYTYEEYYALAQGR